MKAKRIFICILLLFLITISFSSCKSKEVSDVTSDEITINDVVNQSQFMIPSLTEQYGDKIDVQIIERGASMVITFTYKVDIDNDYAAENLESLTKSRDAEHQNTVEKMKELGLTDSSLILEYYTKSGELIYSKEYK
ncbi:MAG: DUF4854 domain-containing protein [Oscillospiraceae bacterium]|jgi:hypothetical protein|nr:DUF4854 domain-containing protein [Oscillospiraceae bacterium]